MRSKAVLFDFDGTLADTAADLVAALNRLRTVRGMAEIPLEKLRPYASAGARGLIVAGFGILTEHPEFKDMREEFLRYYAEAICVETKLFPGMDKLLGAIEARGLRWGIVTNKSTHLTRKIVAAMALTPACVVCGDTTPHLKPHPASLLHAANELALAPKDCLYVGDDLRDILAAHAAGMTSVAVEWGYGDDWHAWNADTVIRQPMDLVAHL
ncbi:MAG TPA: HAD-IA family hydrolase [Burkholderiales bacterium]|jgi:phosphoglycolate phosphatase|nr:HAD-IA family hydrolase [Burkholderiales bacterium]